MSARFIKFVLSLNVSLTAVFLHPKKGARIPIFCLKMTNSESFCVGSRLRVHFWNRGKSFWGIRLQLSLWLLPRRMTGKRSFYLLLTEFLLRLWITLKRALALRSSCLVNSRQIALFTSWRDYSCFFLIIYFLFLINTLDIL